MEYFEKQAAGPVELIGQGMEGAVYDLGGGQVGKVWFNRTPDEVLPLQEFLDELKAQDLPFRTPEISAVDEVGERAVSIEAKLVGTPLSQALESGRVSQQQGLDMFVDVVAALATTHAGSASRTLPVVEESAPFWRYRVSWGDALAGLVSRRADKSQHYLQADVEGFEELVDHVLAKLALLELRNLQIVHGDICTPNLLVDDDGRLALLDWGFYTTAGDNTFDASTAAGFYDMYGPDARAIDDQLLGRFEELGHDRGRMYLYRAAYAITTATIYSEDGSDGHYTWCVNNLNREDLRAAL
ncbi:aminoglycoside phosphotransferase family protein [Kribbella sancticallisti]